MSDYLQNIVLRSLSLAEVVQPRVPQLFEQAGTSAPLPDSSSQAEFVQTTPVVKDPIAELQLTQTPHREGRPTGFEREESAASETRNENHHLPFIVRSVGPSPTVQENPAPAKLIPPVTTPDSGSSVSTVRAETQPERSQASIGPLLREPSIAMIDQKNPPALSNARLQPSVTKSSLPSLAQNLRAESQPQPIKITIGRVDVRAIMPSVPPKAAASMRPKPALSLENYLKQREEGKR